MIGDRHFVCIRADSEYPVAFEGCKRGVCSASTGKNLEAWPGKILGRALHDRPHERIWFLAFVGYNKGALM
jgi:hypothetical protein